ncbi:MAG: hypothetical protein VYE12_02855 [Actinomycetota bacterium]|nr:hypothetical protein [Acidimicrobiaceae bacterium]MEC8464884.1 hypothetical protein [Actinomycetota bacterium]MEC8521741.1 hypothetical protein [Actinomycetota bacterium]MEC9225214.1 hypothetical protein [Actinomycetota bacterium]MED5298683.1 hypothetical protein [Actinomycetota bacterium]
MRTALQHLSRLIIVAIAVTGCAYLTPQDETLPAPQGSSSSGDDVVASPAEEALDEVPDTTQSVQTTITATPATTPTTTIPEPLGVAELILTAGGLGEAAFGSEPDAVISYVSSILGSPTEDSDWTTPETFLCAGTVIREVNWGVLSLVFGDASSSASGRPHFMSYTYGLIDRLGDEPQGLVTSEGLTISNTVATLLDRTDARLDEGDEELEIPPSFFYDREPFPVTGLLTGTSDEDVVLVILGGSGCFG